MPILIAACVGLILGLALARSRPRTLPRTAVDLAAEGALAAALAAAVAWLASAMEPQPAAAGVGIGGFAAIVTAAVLHRVPLRGAAGWRAGPLAVWGLVMAVLVAAPWLGVRPDA